MVNNLHSSLPINVYLSTEIQLSPAQTAGVEASSVTLKTILAVSGWPVRPKMCPTSTGSWTCKILSKEHRPYALQLAHTSPWCQNRALGRALVFWSGDTCHAGHAVGKAWSWDTNDWVLGLTRPPGMCGHELVLFCLGLHFLIGQVITGALRALPSSKHLWLHVKSNRITVICFHLLLRASLELDWLLDTLQNIHCKAIS